MDSSVSTQFASPHIAAGAPHSAQAGLVLRQALLTYVPMDRRQALTQGHNLPVSTTGAALLADVSGFAPLTAALISHFDDPSRALELLTQRLNYLYEALIQQVHRYGGSVVGFVGDAITCWFDRSYAPARQNPGLRAIAAALAMQKTMQRVQAEFQDLPDLPPIQIKIGVAMGPVKRLVVGDRQMQLIDTLVGQTTTRMAAAEQLAEQGEVVLDPDTVARIGHEVSIANWRLAPDTSEPYAVVADLIRPQPSCPWPALPLDDQARVPLKVLQPWTLDAVFDQLQAGQGQFLAELRPAVALFLSFDGINYDRDPEAELKLDAFVRWVQYTLTRYEGHLIQLTIGDKGSFLYAVFGAPNTLNDDTTRALAAARDLQQPPEALAFVQDLKIGIGRGQMRTGAYGGRLRQTYGVIGDAAILAARLMEQAPPGQIYIDYPTYSRSRKDYLFETLPGMRIKGRASLVQAYALLRPRREDDLPLTENRATPGLVGRQNDLRQLRRLVAQIAAGQSQVVLLEGEAGLGKTRLMHAFRERLPEHGLIGLQGAGHSVERRTPYRAWRDILRAFFHLEGRAEPAGQQAQIRSTLTEIAPHLLDRLALLNDILDLDFPETDLVRGLSTELRHRSLQALIVGLFAAWAEEKPPVVLLEDAHYLDSLSWDLALTLAQQNHSLLLAFRPEDLPEEKTALETIKAMTRTTVLHLQPLSSADIRHLIATRLRLPVDRVSPELVNLLCTQADGNPYYAEELIYSLQDLDWLDADGRLQADGTALPLQRLGQHLPDSIQGVILARLDALPATAQLVIKIASVIGQTFNRTMLYELLQREANLGSDELPSILEMLQTRELIVQLPGLSEPTYRFKHITAQEVIYETLLYAQRRRLHLAVAQWYEGQAGHHRSLNLLPAFTAPVPPRLAPYLPLLMHHYQLAEDQASERYYATLSGINAAARFAHTEALVALERAITLTAREDVLGRYHLHLVRETIHDLRGDRAVQQVDLMQLQELAQQIRDSQQQIARRQGEVALRRANYAEATGDYTLALAEARKTINLSRESDAVQQSILAYLTCGRALWHQGRYHEAIECLGLALDQARDHRLPLLEADVWHILGLIALEQSQYDIAQQYQERALPAYQTQQERRGETAVLIELGSIALEQSRLTRAQPFFEEAITLSRQIGDRRSESSATWKLARLYSEQMGYPQAEQLYLTALALTQEIGDRQGEALVQAELSLLAWRQGNFMNAQDYGETARRMAQMLGDRRTEALAQLRLGRALLAQHQQTAARAAFETALTLRLTLTQHNLSLEPYLELAALRLEAEPAAALAALEGRWSDLTVEGVAGTDEPLRLFDLATNILQAHQDPRLGMLQQEAYAVRAARNFNPETQVAAA